MYLDEIFKSAPHIEIKQLSCDSRMPMQDAIFFCVDGSVYNGHSFYQEAIKNGAKVIIYDTDIDTNYNAIFIKVSNVEDVLNKIAIRFYNDPCAKLNTYVVSGCYGKAVVTYILNKLISKYEKSAYISDRGIYDGHDYRSTSYRTLNCIETLNVSNKMLKGNIKSAIYESSVMNLALKKLDVVKANYFIYTTTGVESSEYRELNKSYESNLFSYLTRLNKDCLLVVNRDDDLFQSLTRNTFNRYISYGRSDDSDYRISSVCLYKNKTKFNLIVDGTKYNVETKLLGLSNVYNLTSCIAALANRYPIQELIDAAKDITPLDGSFYQVELGQDFNVLIDGASNYETCKLVYQYAKVITNDKKRIIAVLPINYLDNAAKLKELIELSEDTVDYLILTSGDTYGKDLSQILHNAFTYVKKTKGIIIEDREVAINLAIDSANSYDTVILLGKGEENFIYKTLGKSSYPTDKKIATEAIRRRINEISEVY